MTYAIVICLSVLIATAHAAGSDKSTVKRYKTAGDEKNTEENARCGNTTMRGGSSSSSSNTELRIRRVPNHICQECGNKYPASTVHEKADQILVALHGLGEGLKGLKESLELRISQKRAFPRKGDNHKRKWEDWEDWTSEDATWQWTGNSHNKKDDYYDDDGSGRGRDYHAYRTSASCY